jgi:hypothetical protein
MRKLKMKTSEAITVCEKLVKLPADGTVAYYERNGSYIDQHRIVELTDALTAVLTELREYQELEAAAQIITFEQYGIFKWGSLDKWGVGSKTETLYGSAYKAFQAAKQAVEEKGE